MPAHKITQAERNRRKIKAARVEAGLTQEKLGKKIGVTQTTISMWEKDYRRMGVGDLEMLCRILKLDPTELLERA